MTLTVRTRKLLLIAGAALGAVLLAMVAAPYLVDVEAYKPAMADAVKRATGRELVIEGKMEFSMFPTPHVAARNVRFANAVGGKGAQMVDVKWVGVTPSWLALLTGQVEIGQLTLARPTIVLETDAQGRPNWELEPEAGARQSPGAASKGFNLTIGKLAIVDGTLSYTDPKSGTSIVAQKINAAVAVGSLSGPFEFEGTATVNDLPLRLDARMSAPTEKGHQVTLALKVDIGTLNFKGNVSEISSSAVIKGHLSLATSSVGDFATKLVHATGRPTPTLHSAVAGKFSFDGGIEVEPDRIAVNDFKVGFGGETATGSLALTEKPRVLLVGKLSLPSLDIDKWQAAFAQPNGLIPDETKARIAAAPTQSPFPEMDVKLALDVANVTLQKGKISDVSTYIAIDKGVISIPRLVAKLPGEMAFSADSKNGQVSLAGTKLRETLAWLGLDVSDVPAGRLERFQLDGKFVAAAGTLQVAEAKFAIDGQQGTGGAILTLSPATAVALQATFSEFDLDPYLPPPSSDFVLARTAPPAAMGVPLDAWSTGAGVPLNVKAKVGKLVLRKQPFSGLDADVTFQGGGMKLNDVKVAGVLGGRFAVKGSLSGLDDVPSYDLTGDISAPDADKVLGFLNVPVLRLGALGAGTLSGSIKGTGLNATLRNVTANFLGTVAQATGTLSFEGDGRFDFSSFSLKSADISRVVSAAAGKPSSGIGAVSANGKLTGSMARAVFTGQAEVHGAQLTGTVDATLGTRPMVVANLQVPGVFDLDKWLGVSAAPASAVAAPAAGAPATAPGRARTVTGAPIDTAALNGFDAKLTLRTGATTIASVRLDHAAIDATLRNGTLTVSKLTGKFFGGGIDASGTVKTTGNAVALDFKGNVIGIYLGEMLRGTAGRNTFGEDIAVAVDGKINATNMQISGSGRTPEEIRNGLKGSATMGGYVYPSVDPRSRSSALFFGGIAGLFSDDIKAGVLVLKRFANRENPIAGQVTMANGTVTLNNQTVSGDQATARVSGVTNVAAATTQTTITFDTSGNSSSRLVTTVRGPLSAPTLDTSRSRAVRAY